MSQQKEEKPVNLFLKNTFTTTQQKRTNVKFFIAKDYGEMLETPYEDGHVIIQNKKCNASAHITDINGKCRLLVSPPTMGKMLHVNDDDIYNYSKSIHELFVKNYDHFVNAFKVISEKYDAKTESFDDMVVFGLQNTKPIISISKIDAMETVKNHDIGYYISPKVKKWIVNRGGLWFNDKFRIDVRNIFCNKNDERMNIGVQCGTYTNIQDQQHGYAKPSIKCFIDNFDQISDGFKALNKAFKADDLGFDKSEGIVFD